MFRSQWTIIREHVNLAKVTTDCYFFLRLHFGAAKAAPKCKPKFYFNKCKKFYSVKDFRTKNTSANSWFNNLYIQVYCTV